LIAENHALREKLAQATDQLDKAQVKSEATAACIQQDSTENKGNDAHSFAVMRQLLRSYRELTAINLSVVEDEDTENALNLECIAFNKQTKAAVKFELVIPENKDEEIEYLPTANTHLLPDYLQDEICFAQSEAPVFMHKVFSALYRPAVAQSQC